MDNQVENAIELEINKKISKKLSWVIALILILNISLIGSLYYVTSKIDQINIHLNENSACTFEKEDASEPQIEEPGIDIFEKEYYQSNLLTVDTFNELTNDLTEYLIYFERNDCKFCKQSNIDVDKYMIKGYGEADSDLPLFFAETQTASFLINKYEIDTYPTLVYVQNDSEVVYKGMVEVNGFIENRILELNHVED